MANGSAAFSCPRLKPPGKACSKVFQTKQVQTPQTCVWPVGKPLCACCWGWGLASLIGVALGTLIGMSVVARQWIAPTLEFLRPLPASAVLPLAISIFGLSSGMVLFVVSFGAMWPVLLATVQGLANVEPRLREVAAGLQMSRTAFAWKIGLPATLPDILAGMRLSMTVSLIVAVVGEMIASQVGLGQAILLAARSFRASELFAGIVLLGALGFVSNALLAGLEHRLLRWQRP